MKPTQQNRLQGRKAISLAISVLLTSPAALATESTLLAEQIGFQFEQGQPLSDTQLEQLRGLGVVHELPLGDLLSVILWDEDRRGRGNGGNSRTGVAPRIEINTGTRQ